MENPEAKSKWDNLVRELAVEIPPEVQQREEAVASAKPQAAAPPSQPRETSAPPAPKRSATKTNWNSLVTDLGLPPLEEPEPIAAAPPAKPEITKPISRPEPPREREREPEQARGRRPERPERQERPERSDRERSDRERPPRREQSGPRRERPEQNREQAEPRRDDTEQGREQSRPRRERSDQDREQVEPRRENAEQGREKTELRREGRGQRGGRGRGGRGRGGRDHQRDDQGTGERGRARSGGGEQDRDRGREREREPERDDRPEPDMQETAAEPMPPHEPPKPAAVSLWHKIFGSPAEQTAKVVDEPVDEVGSPSDLRNEPRSAGSGFSDAHPDEQMQMFDESDEGDRSGESENATDEEARSDRPRGRSRRRGRGRGRGRKPDDHPPEVREARPPRQRDDEPRVEKSHPELEDEFTDEELMEDNDADVSLDDGDLDDDDSNGVATGAGISRSAALQRSIPSWDEAIGFIVDTNMQSRSQRRPPSRPGGGSRDNGSRGGRGRGRRKS